MKTKKLTYTHDELVQLRPGGVITELDFIQIGEQAVVSDGKSILTIGIDLCERTGIRIERGKTAKWSRERDAGMDSYNFGLYGCWVKQATGGLSYVPEEEYTEEILAAQQKAVERNSAIIKR